MVIDSIGPFDSMTPDGRVRALDPDTGLSGDGRMVHSALRAASNPPRMPTPLPRLGRGPSAATAVLLAAAAACGCGSDDNSSSAQTPTAKTTTTARPAKGALAARLDEWSVKPSARRVRAGTVKLTATNSGKTAHELVVLRTDKPAARLAKPGARRAPEAGNVGEVGDLAAAKRGTTVLRLKPGHYVLICNLPGHWAAGMRADLTVE